MEDNYFYKNFRRRVSKFGLDNITDFLIKRVRKLNKKKKIGFLILILVCLFYLFYFSAPAFNFSNTGLVFTINDGSSVKKISQDLKQVGLIRSPLFFNLFVKTVGGEKKVKAGKYLFERSQNLFGVVWRIIEGEQGFDPIKLSIPEGASVYEISLLAEQKIEGFDKDKFLELSGDSEGYLFPDTYFLPPDVTPETLFTAMRENFDKRIEPLLDNIKKFGKSLDEVVIMASILEEEARTMETRQIVSGILWSRIGIDMPLQVDATFLYINGKNTYELTLADLQDDSSLYNTYTHKGLPIGPITNPGLDAIWATINPTESNYLYYLSDKSGNMYYAKTFEEHKLNKSKYLHTY